MIFTIYLKNGNITIIEGNGINITDKNIIVAGTDRLITAEFDRECFAGYCIGLPLQTGTTSFTEFAEVRHDYLRYVDKEEAIKFCDNIISEMNKNVMKGRKYDNR
jgi:hypothetical protein